jgi:hypothetical protein
MKCTNRKYLLRQRPQFTTLEKVDQLGSGFSRLSMVASSVSPQKSSNIHAILPVVKEEKEEDTFFQMKTRRKETSL